MATELGQAYVQIMPSAKGIQGSISGVLNGEATSAGTSAGGLLGNKLVGAITGIIATAKIGQLIGDTIKQSLAEGANLEQSLGGSEAVFGGFAKSVQKTAQDAYKNMGLSASSYMETANKMGSLFQGSGISQAKSLDLTTKAMQRASDVASVMGVDTSMAMESIAGAAKGNFEMMDNLGVAMNASTLQAYALQKGINFKWDTASNAEKATLAMKMFMEKTAKYAGNFKKEASSTYSGSLDSMKASYKNFLGSLSLGENVLPSFVNLTKTVSTFIFGNFFPMMGNMLTGLGELIGNSLGSFLPTLKTKISTGLATLTNNMPEILNSGVKMVTDLVNGFLKALPEIWSAFGQITSSLAQFLMDNGPLILEAGGKLLLNIADGIIQNLPSIALSAVQAVTQFISTIYNNLPEFLGAGFEILGNLISGIIQRIPTLTDTAIRAIGTFVQGLLSKLPDIASSGVKAIVSLSEGILGALGKVTLAIGKVANTIIESITGVNLASAGRAIMDGFLNGLTSGFESVKNFVGGIAQWIKDHKGPISYDKVLLIDAGNAIMDGLHNGLLDNFNHSVKPLVSGMAGQLRDAFGIPTLSADVGIAQPNMSAVTASTYQLMSNFGQGSFEQASLSDVVNEIRQLRNRQQVIEAHLDSNLVGRLIANPVGSTLRKQEMTLNRLRGEI